MHAQIHSRTYARMMAQMAAEGAEPRQATAMPVVWRVSTWSRMCWLRPFRPLLPRCWLHPSHSAAAPSSAHSGNDSQKILWKISANTSSGNKQPTHYLEKYVYTVSGENIGNTGARCEPCVQGVLVCMCPCVHALVCVRSCVHVTCVRAHTLMCASVRIPACIVSYIPCYHAHTST